MSGSRSTSKQEDEILCEGCFLLVKPSQFDARSPAGRRRCARTDDTNTDTDGAGTDNTDGAGTDTDTDGAGTDGAGTGDGAGGVVRDADRILSTAARGRCAARSAVSRWFAARQRACPFERSVHGRFELGESA